MAVGDLGPSIAGLDLALHARIHAAVNAGVPREQILSHEGLTLESWERADSRWQLALAESAEGDGQLLEQWDGAVAAAAGQFTRRVHPIEDEIEAWMDFVRHCQASDDFIGALHAAGLGISDWQQLQARWNTRIGSDAELCQRMAESLSGPASDPPELSFDPISLPPPLRDTSSARMSASPAVADSAADEGDENANDEDSGQDEVAELQDAAGASSVLPAFEVPATAPSHRESGSSPISQPSAYDPLEIPEFLRRSAADAPAPPPNVPRITAPPAALLRPEMVEPARVSISPVVPETLSPSGGPVPRVPGNPTTQPIAVMPPPVWPSSVPAVGGTPLPEGLVTGSQSPLVAASQTTSSPPSVPGVFISSPLAVREVRSISPTEIPLFSQPPPMVSPPMVSPPMVSPPMVSPPMVSPPMPVSAQSTAGNSQAIGTHQDQMQVVTPPQISVMLEPSTSFAAVPIAPHVPITPLPLPPGDFSGASEPVPALQPMAIVPPPVVPLGALPVVQQLPIAPSDSLQSSHYASESAFGTSPRAALVMPPTVIPDSFAPMPASPLENASPVDHAQQSALGGLQPHFGPPPSERFMSASGISASSSSPPPLAGAAEVHSAIRGSEQYQRALQVSDALAAPPAAGGGTRAVDLPPEFRAMLRGQPLSGSERPSGSRSHQAPVAEPPRVNAPVRFASQAPPAEPALALDGISRSAASIGGTPHFAPPAVVAPPPPVIAPPAVVAPPPAVIPQKAPNSPLPATELKPLNKLPWEK